MAMAGVSNNGVTEWRNKRHDRRIPGKWSRLAPLPGRPFAFAHYSPGAFREGDMKPLSSELDTPGYGIIQSGNIEL